MKTTYARPYSTSCYTRATLALALTFLLTVVLIPGIGRAQQDPYYSHFKFVPQAYNPASAGQRDGYICVSALSHNQWRGFNDYTFVDRPPSTDQNQVISNVAPSTYNFNISTQVSKPGRRSFGALGLSMYDDQLGFMRTSSLKVQGAVFAFLGTGRLSVGMELGLTQFGYVNPQFRFLHPNDPRIPQSSVSDQKPDVGIGFLYTARRLGPYIEDLYMGTSMSHVNGARYALANAGTYTLDRHYYLHGGCNIPVSRWSSVLEPAFLVKYNSKPQVDLNLTVLRNQTYRFGVGYRQWQTLDAISLLMGWVHNQIQLGYSYDITASKIQTVSNGTHEFFVKYCFQLDHKDDQFYWKTIRDL
ncbi:MAG: type IX secretion system membrane protein PorP/SprF [Bacteroidia bacterium]|nr:type IX secretion system membrane protein PorP/SprF [Bacteroidia bacterium]